MRRFGDVRSGAIDGLAFMVDLLRVGKGFKSKERRRNAANNAARASAARALEDGRARALVGAKHTKVLGAMFAHALTPTGIHTHTRTQTKVG